MNMCPPELEKVLRSGSPTKALAFFESMPESRRAEYASAVINWSRLLHLHWEAESWTKAEKQLAATERIAHWRALLPVSSLAELACLNLSQIRDLKSTFDAEHKDIVKVLRDRRPDWLDEFAEFLCEGALVIWGNGRWQLVRLLVREGLVRPPKHDHYALAAICHIWTSAKADPAPDLVQLLLAERDWLETDFWRLFELEGTGEISLANRDKYRRTGASWSESLVELSRRGEIPRDRLLDASLSALSRDFIQFRAGWFSRFHELLEPTPQERSARIDSYLTLLASNIPPTVSFAVAATAIADQDRPLPAAKLLPELKPVLHARAKASVKAALRLLARVAKREPAAVPEICHMAVAGLLSDASDVQKEVFDFLDHFADRNDAELRAAIGEYANAIAASLRPRLRSWLTLEDVAPSSGKVSAELVPERRSVVSCIDPSRAIEPVVDFDELLHLSTAILEQPDDPDQLERMLDGLSRLCDTRPDDFARRVGPLRKRAIRKHNQQSGLYPLFSMVERCLAMLILTWTDGEIYFEETPASLPQNQNEFHFLFRRLAVLSRQVKARRALPLHSAPTHIGGWIEPSALVDRWLAWQSAGHEPDLYEQVLALLRLANERRSEALERAKLVRGESGEALRFALGEPAKMGSVPALWLAAWRSREPFEDLPDFEKAYPNLGPDAGEAAAYQWTAKSEEYRHAAGAISYLRFEVSRRPKCPKRIGDGLLPVLFHGSGYSMGEALLSEIRWKAMLWPANLEAVFASATGRLVDAIHGEEVPDQEITPYLEPICYPYTKMRPMACLALALGLTAKSSAARGLAQDGFIAAITDGRLDVDQLGATMSRLLDTGHNKLVRWAKSLREVARVSPEHAQVAVEVLQGTLKGNPQNAPRDIAALLELLVELVSETGVMLDADVQKYLSGLASGGKTKRLVKQLQTHAGNRGGVGTIPMQATHTDDRVKRRL